MKNIDVASHTRGESVYLDDIPVLAGTLYAACFDSPIAHGTITNLDLSEALRCDGVVRILTASDIPGENQIGGIIPDEPLLADGTVHFCGMPVALVIARSDHEARAALKKIVVQIDPLPVITDPREAAKARALIVPPRTFRIGDSNAAFEQCATVVSGTCEINGQEHLYIETQGAYAIPGEQGAVRIYSSTQGPTAVQRAVSRVTGLPMHQVEIDVTRLGGGFGGKEDQANTWAALCAVASVVTGKPVKYSLHRMEDMRMTGKRHPYSADFKIGLDADLSICAFETTCYQNAGAAADLSPAVMERTLFHCTNTYHIPNVTATAFSCKTHLPPNTAFRGFGGPQGMFIIESAIQTAADRLGIRASVIQQKNLLHDGDELPYGQKVVSEAHACWNRAEELYDLKAIEAAAARFNEQGSLFRKGVAVMPICFGISFTNTPMNQARALVHVYTDGSVLVSTGAVEMGQGVNTKILQVAAGVFGVTPEKIKLASTNTYRIANTSPSAASATADLNGKATEIACESIADRLLDLVATETGISRNQLTLSENEVKADGASIGWNWNKLVQTAWMKRVSLSEHGHYSTPDIHFDKSTEKGHPFAYHVYGTSITQVTLDCLRGTYVIDFVKLVHDFGKSMNPLIDRGQIEGGLVQGIGWMTMEEIVYDQQGKLRSNALSTYKVPDIFSAPREIQIEFLPSGRPNLAIRQSKAVGEPPLMYGIGSYFALLDAVRSFNPDAPLLLDAPMTPEKVLGLLYPNEI